MRFLQCNYCGRQREHECKTYDNDNGCTVLALSHIASTSYVVLQIYTYDFRFPTMLHRYNTCILFPLTEPRL